MFPNTQENPVLDPLEICLSSSGTLFINCSRGLVVDFFNGTLITSNYKTINEALVTGEFGAVLHSFLAKKHCL